jgi:hypothetical protein
VPHDPADRLFGHEKRKPSGISASFVPRRTTTFRVWKNYEYSRVIFCLAELTLPLKTLII